MILRELVDFGERALLAVGNYMLFVGQNNSLLTSSRNVAWSWKVLLRNVAAAGHASPILKELWDHLRRACFIRVETQQINPVAVQFRSLA